MKLFNTRGKELQEFETLSPGKVLMYSCGPTVYNYFHIGNFRAALLSDITRRTLELHGYHVTQVMNITDFGHLVADSDDGEDKMTLALRREALDLTMANMFALAVRYIDAFKSDIAKLNILMPHYMPRASEHVPGMIDYVDKLLLKGYAYKTSDGVYFDTVTYSAYGAFGVSASAEHSRTGVASEKHNMRDFALWKFTDDPSMGWDAPWGRGFPGWHIECTAMSTEYLGKSFDIHTGGVDHISIHHTNELAQAEAANGVPYSRYWLHNEFVMIDNARIAKSLKNEVLLSDIESRGIAPLAYRYWLLTAHYRQAVNFTWEALEAANTARTRALRIFNDLPLGGAVSSVYLDEFRETLGVDLDTPGSVALLWKLLKDDSVSPADKRETILAMDRVLGIGFGVEESVPQEVQVLLEERKAARARGDFAQSDALRDALAEKGYTVRDTDAGQKVERV